MREVDTKWVGGGGGERSFTTLICDNLAINRLAKDLLYH